MISKISWDRGCWTYGGGSGYLEIGREAAKKMEILVVFCSENRLISAPQARIFLEVFLSMM